MLKDYIEAAINDTVTNVFRELDLSDNIHAQRLLEIEPRITTLHLLNGESGFMDGDEEFPVIYSNLSHSYYGEDAFIDALHEYDYDNEGAVDRNIYGFLSQYMFETSPGDHRTLSKVPLSDVELELYDRMYMINKELFNEYMIVSIKLAQTILKGSEDIFPKHRWYTIDIE